MSTNCCEGAYVDKEEVVASSHGLCKKGAIGGIALELLDSIRQPSPLMALSLNLKVFPITPPEAILQLLKYSLYQDPNALVLNNYT